jgi:CBS domain-containing protein
MLVVQGWMTSNLATLSLETSVAEALALCQERQISHILILE